MGSKKKTTNKVPLPMCTEALKYDLYIFYRKSSFPRSLCKIIEKRYVIILISEHFQFNIDDYLGTKRTGLFQGKNYS